MIHTGQIANSHNGEQRTRDEIAAGRDERGKRITERGDGPEQEQTWERDALTVSSRRARKREAFLFMRYNPF
jgi:hypothetical protein